MAGLYHLARLNDRWFRLDEALELLGVIPPPSQVQKYAVNCSWFQETFGECPEDADEDTVRRYARAYIMMLLGTQLFADKSGNRIHIRWLPYVVRLEELGTYSWGSAALAWLYRCMCRVANRHVVKLAGPLQLLQSWIFWRFPRFRPAGYETFSWPLASRWSGYNPSGSKKGPRVAMWRLRIDRLQDREFIWMPYSSPDVLQVLHPEVLEPRHMALWHSVTALIYFAVIEWHQIDRVLPQFGGVQPPPLPALNIDFLMSKDGRGGDRWFPSYLQKWHLYWDSRQESVLRFDVVADPGPSHEFLEWWSQHGKRFLYPDTQMGDPRAVPVPVEASQRGPGRVPDMDRPEDVPDRRRVERRMGVGTRRSQHEWR
ncbi:serine/threonine-protein phosphatase 7 long form homolog [Arachis hypogaea]|uniref:serine/threonine-protein phosphatase 7 long form homolog n=1 Tax=Arachis hypogaea TaxID=3818 RepID=UPI003B222052